MAAAPIPTPMDEPGADSGPDAELLPDEWAAELQIPHDPLKRPVSDSDRESGLDATADAGPCLNWLFVDLNSYFASVEQEVRPELRGRPVAVVPMMADTTVCIAASYEAKAFGVKTGTVVADAKRLCPEIVLIEGRHDIYVRFL